MRTLVVTGDDFGFSKGVNRGIVEAHDHGILTSASLMVTGEAAQEAVELARCRPSLTVGLHLVVVDGKAALPPPEVASLVDTSGRFRGGPLSAGLRYQFSSRSRRELAQEIRAQLERFRDTGLPLSHVDGHHHMHLHPVVLDVLTELAHEFQIPSIRLPSEELRLGVGTGLPVRAFWTGVFACLRAYGERRLRQAGIDYFERVYGLLETGRITEEYLIDLIPRIRAGRVELYCHPAAALPGEPPQGPSASGPTELAALLSERVRDVVERSGFVLARGAAAARISAL